MKAEIITNPKLGIRLYRENPVAFVYFLEFICLANKPPFDISNFSSKPYIDLFVFNWSVGRLSKCVEYINEHLVVN